MARAAAARPTCGQVGPGRRAGLVDGEKQRRAEFRSCGTAPACRHKQGACNTLLPCPMRRRRSPHRPCCDGHSAAHPQLAGAEGLEGRLAAQHQHLRNRNGGGARWRGGARQLHALLPSQQLLVPAPGETPAVPAQRAPCPASSPLPPKPPACLPTSQQAAQLTRSCTSSPSCQPTLDARLSSAEGADQPPSGVRATTRPLPTLRLHPAPTRATLSTASPAAPRRMAGGMVRSGGSEPTAGGEGDRGGEGEVGARLRGTQCGRPPCHRAVRIRNKPLLPPRHLPPRALPSACSPPLHRTRLGKCAQDVDRLVELVLHAGGERRAAGQATVGAVGRAALKGGGGGGLGWLAAPLAGLTTAGLGHCLRTHASCPEGAL